MPDLSLSGAQFDIGTNGERHGLKVAAIKNGTFVAVWSQHQGSKGNIFAQILNADGTPKDGGVPFQVKADLTGNQNNPTIAALRLVGIHTSLGL